MALCYADPNTPTVPFPAQGKVLFLFYAAEGPATVFRGIVRETHLEQRILRPANFFPWFKLQMMVGSMTVVKIEITSLHSPTIQKRGLWHCVFHNHAGSLIDFA